MQPELQLSPLNVIYIEDSSMEKGIISIKHFKNKIIVKTKTKLSYWERITLKERINRIQTGLYTYKAGLTYRSNVHAVMSMRYKTHTENDIFIIGTNGITYTKTTVGTKTELAEIIFKFLPQ